MTLALSDLMLRARRRADMEFGKFISDPELIIYVNDSYGELYDILVARFQDYFVQAPWTFTISGSASTGINWTVLPTDFYKFLGIDMDLGGGQWQEINPFNFDARNKSYRGGRASAIGYRIIGANLYLTPKSNADGNFRLWYIPTRPTLIKLTDTIDRESERWAQYIEVDAAIKCKAKQDDDVSTLEYSKQQLTKRISEMASNRNAGAPEKIQDVRSRNYPDIDHGQWW